MTTTPSVPATWFERARRVTPGGVHSPVRAFAAMRCDPIAVVSARGAHGCATPPAVSSSTTSARGDRRCSATPTRGSRRRWSPPRGAGCVFGLASPPEVELAERIVARVPGCEMVRFVVTGTEATMSAVRVARAATGRRVIVKFAGAYHGHADMFLVSAGSGAATFGTPDSPGVTPGAVQDTAIARFNDLASVRSLLRRGRGRRRRGDRRAGGRQHGLRAAGRGFLDGLRDALHPRTAPC